MSIFFGDQTSDKVTVCTKGKFEPTKKKLKVVISPVLDRKDERYINHM